jgi:hypothetical protein
LAINPSRSNFRATWRALLAYLIGLQKLKRRLPTRIKSGNLAIDDKVFRGQQFQGVEQFRVIERLLIARDQPRFFALLKASAR